MTAESNVARPTTRRVSAIVVTVAVTFHWIPNYWWHHTSKLLGGLPFPWALGASMLALGAALTLWSPQIFGLTWSDTWKRRRCVAFIGGGMTLVACVGMLFIRVPFFGESASIYLCTPLFEELMFRGFIFAVLADAFPRTLAVGRLRFSTATLISAVAFGLWHLGGLNWPENGFILFQVFYTSIAGFLFALIRERTGSLYAPWFVHFLVNAWAVNVPGFWVFGLP